MNRRLLLVVGLAAVVALLAGAAVGRNLLSPPTSPPAASADVVRFKDDVADVSIEYPASWRALPTPADDPEVALLVARDDSASLLMRVSATGLAPVTRTSLPIVRKLTDDLIGADPRAKQLVPPARVVLGGLPGWRYRYTFASHDGGGAHDHYFLFKGGQMIQLVFQAAPASRLPELAPTFDRIAATFQGRVS